MKHAVFLGNGFNQCNASNSISWDKLLNELANTYKVDFNKDFDFSHKTLFYERIVLSEKGEKKINEKEEVIKNKIAEMMKNLKSSSLYKNLIELDIDDIITTNYDSCICDAAEEDYIIHNMDNSEKIYSIRRHSQIEKKADSINVWNIHGSIANPKSIMLGLDHYCGSISKISNYIKGAYVHSNDKTKIPSIKSKLKGVSGYDVSWIDLFFNSNIYIVGCGFNYAEIDLWWILNKRSRILKSIGKVDTNKILFYELSIDPDKKRILNDFNVEVIDFGNEFPNINKDNTEYQIYYEKVLEDIRKRIKESKKV